MTAVLRLVEPGLLSQIQGAPYRGQRDAGMPLAGAVDPLSRALANWLAGNGAETPAIETGFAPIAIEALCAVTLGVAGAAAELASVNGEPVQPHHSIQLSAGDLLRLDAPPSGCRSYVALAGGIACPELMGAQSTYLPGGFGGLGVLGPGTELAAAGTPVLDQPRILTDELTMPAPRAHILRIVAAPESDRASLDALTRESGWRVGNRADRIGVELEGESLPEGERADMQSSAAFPGTIQAPPAGQPFLLGPDAATMGGYPRIAQLVRADRHLFGQLRPGARVQFVAITAEAACALNAEKMALLKPHLPDLILD